MATSSEKTSEKTAHKISDTHDVKDIKEIKGDAKDPVAAAPARDRDPARDKAIDTAVSTIEKQFGKGSIMRLG